MEFMFTSLHEPKAQLMLMKPKVRKYFLMCADSMTSLLTSLLTIFHWFEINVSPRQTQCSCSVYTPFKNTEGGLNQRTPVSKRKEAELCTALCASMMRPEILTVPLVMMQRTTRFGVKHQQHVQQHEVKIGLS